MTKVIHFEIPIVDPEKSLKFYENVFGWTFGNYGDMDYWLANTGKEDEVGIMGAMIKKAGGETIQEIETADKAVNAVITISVKDLDETIKLIEENGGVVTTDKNTIPNVGTHIYFRDLDGNLIGAMQSSEDMGI